MSDASSGTDEDWSAAEASSSDGEDEQWDADKVTAVDDQSKLQILNSIEGQQHGTTLTAHTVIRAGAPYGGSELTAHATEGVTCASVNTCGGVTRKLLNKAGKPARGLMLAEVCKTLNYIVCVQETHVMQSDDKLVSGNVKEHTDGEVKVHLNSPSRAATKIPGYNRCNGTAVLTPTTTESEITRRGDVGRTMAVQTQVRSMITTDTTNYTLLTSNAYGVTAATTTAERNAQQKVADSMSVDVATAEGSPSFLHVVNMDGQVASDPEHRASGLPLNHDGFKPMHSMLERHGYREVHGTLHPEHVFMTFTKANKPTSKLDSQWVCPRLWEMGKRVNEDKGKAGNAIKGSVASRPGVLSPDHHLLLTTLPVKYANAPPPPDQVPRPLRPVHARKLSEAQKQSYGDLVTTRGNIRTATAAYDAETQMKGWPEGAPDAVDIVRAANVNLYNDKLLQAHHIRPCAAGDPQAAAARETLQCAARQHPGLNLVSLQTTVQDAADTLLDVLETELPAIEELIAPRKAGPRPPRAQGPVAETDAIWQLEQTLRDVQRGQGDHVVLGKRARMQAKAAGLDPPGHDTTYTPAEWAAWAKQEMPTARRTAVMTTGRHGPADAKAQLYERVQNAYGKKKKGDAVDALVNAESRLLMLTDPQLQDYLQATIENISADQAMGPAAVTATALLQGILTDTTTLWNGHTLTTVCALRVAKGRAKEARGRYQQMILTPGQVTPAQDKLMRESFTVARPSSADAVAVDRWQRDNIEEAAALVEIAQDSAIEFLHAAMSNATAPPDTAREWYEQTLPPGSVTEVAQLLKSLNRDKDAHMITAEWLNWGGSDTHDAVLRFMRIFAAGVEPNRLKVALQVPGYKKDDVHQQPRPISIFHALHQACTKRANGIEADMFRQYTGCEQQGGVPGRNLSNHTWLHELVVDEATIKKIHTRTSINDVRGAFDMADLRMQQVAYTVLWMPPGCVSCRTNNHRGQKRLTMTRSTTTNVTHAKVLKAGRGQGDGDSGMGYNATNNLNIRVVTQHGQGFKFNEDLEVTITGFVDDNTLFGAPQGPDTNTVAAGGQAAQAAAAGGAHTNMYKMLLMYVVNGLIASPTKTMAIDANAGQGRQQLTVPMVQDRRLKMRQIPVLKEMTAPARLLGVKYNPTLGLDRHADTWADTFNKAASFTAAATRARTAGDDLRSCALAMHQKLNTSILLKVVPTQMQITVAEHQLDHNAAKCLQKLCGDYSGVSVPEYLFLETDNLGVGFPSPSAAITVDTVVDVMTALNGDQEKIRAAMLHAIDNHTGRDGDTVMSRVQQRLSWLNGSIRATGPPTPPTPADPRIAMITSLMMPLDDVCWRALSENDVGTMRINTTSVGKATLAEVAEAIETGSTETSSFVHMSIQGMKSTHYMCSGAARKKVFTMAILDKRSLGDVIVHDASKHEGKGEDHPLSAWPLAVKLSEEAAEVVVDFRQGDVRALLDPTENPAMIVIANIDMEGYDASKHSNKLDVFFALGAKGLAQLARAREQVVRTLYPKPEKPHYEIGSDCSMKSYSDNPQVALAEKQLRKIVVAPSLSRQRSRAAHQCVITASSQVAVDTLSQHKKAGMLAYVFWVETSGEERPQFYLHHFSNIGKNGGTVTVADRRVHDPVTGNHWSMAAIAARVRNGQRQLRTQDMHLVNNSVEVGAMARQARRVISTTKQHALWPWRLASTTVLHKQTTAAEMHAPTPAETDTPAMIRTAICDAARTLAGRPRHDWRKLLAGRDIAVTEATMTAMCAAAGTTSARKKNAAIAVNLDNYLFATAWSLEAAKLAQDTHRQTFEAPAAPGHTKTAEAQQRYAGWMEGEAETGEQGQAPDTVYCTACGVELANQLAYEVHAVQRDEPCKQSPGSRKALAVATASYDTANHCAGRCTVRRLLDPGHASTHTHHGEGQAATDSADTAAQLGEGAACALTSDSLSNVELLRKVRGRELHTRQLLNAGNFGIMRYMEATLQVDTPVNHTPATHDSKLGIVPTVIQLLNHVCDLAAKELVEDELRRIYGWDETAVPPSSRDTPSYHLWWRGTNVVVRSGLRRAIKARVNAMQLRQIVAGPEPWAATRPAQRAKPMYEALLHGRVDIKMTGEIRRRLTPEVFDLAITHQLDIDALDISGLAAEDRGPSKPALMACAGFLDQLGTPCVECGRKGEKGTSLRHHVHTCPVYANHRQAMTAATAETIGRTGRAGWFASEWAPKSHGPECKCTRMCRWVNEVATAGPDARTELRGRHGASYKLHIDNIIAVDEAMHSTSDKTAERFERAAQILSATVLNASKGAVLATHPCLSDSIRQVYAVTHMVTLATAAHTSSFTTTTLSTNNVAEETSEPWPDRTYIAAAHHGTGTDNEHLAQLVARAVNTVASPGGTLVVMTLAGKAGSTRDQRRQYMNEHDTECVKATEVIVLSPQSVLVAEAAGHAGADSKWQTGTDGGQTLSAPRRCWTEVNRDSRLQDTTGATIFVFTRRATPPPQLNREARRTMAWALTATAPMRTAGATPVDFAVGREGDRSLHMRHQHWGDEKCPTRIAAFFLTTGREHMCRPNQTPNDPDLDAAEEATFAETGNAGHDNAHTMRLAVCPRSWTGLLRAVGVPHMQRQAIILDVVQAQGAMLLQMQADRAVATRMWLHNVGALVHRKDEPRKPVRGARECDQCGVLVACLMQVKIYASKYLTHADAANHVRRRITAAQGKTPSEAEKQATNTTAMLEKQGVHVCLPCRAPMLAEERAAAEAKTTSPPRSSRKKSRRWTHRVAPTRQQEAEAYWSLCTQAQDEATLPKGYTAVTTTKGGGVRPMTLSARLGGSANQAVANKRKRDRSSKGGGGGRAQKTTKKGAKPPSKHRGGKRK